MCWAAAPIVAAQVSAAATVASTAFSMYSAQQMSKYQQKVMQNNARMAELQAADAIRQGEIEAQQYGEGVDRLMSQQKVALAANGLLIDAEDSSGGVLLDTKAIGERDMLQIKNNAARQAWGYRVQAQDYLQQGQIARAEGYNRQLSSLLSGAGSVADKWYRFSRENPNWI